MKVSVVADFNWESKLDHAMRTLDLRSAFASKDYGADVQSLSLCLMCRSSDLLFKQRVRYKKAEKYLQLDIMLDIDQFIPASQPERRQLLASALVHGVAEVLAKRGFKQFDLNAFRRDLEETVRKQLSAPEANRFDHLSLERATRVGS